MNEAEIKQAAEEYANCFHVPEGEKHGKYIGFIAGAEANAPKWIPVTERMPHERQPVLIFIPAQDNYAGSGIWEQSCGWYETYNHDLIDHWEVTHWMPLPSQPNTQP